MAAVYQTLDGTFYISLGRSALLEISRSKLPVLPDFTRGGYKRIGDCVYTFIDNKLMYGNAESVYIGIAEIISELLDGTCVDEIMVVDNDFLEEWKK